LRFFLQKLQFWPYIVLASPSDPFLEAHWVMPASTVVNRKDVNRDIALRVARSPLAPPNGTGANGAGPGGVPARISDYFGINTLGARQMRDKLPRDVYTKLVAAIRMGKKLDVDIAPRIAQVIKEWAVSRGATHYTHWFQPLTGL